MLNVILMWVAMLWTGDVVLFVWGINDYIGVFGKQYLVTGLVGGTTLVCRPVDAETAPLVALLGLAGNSSTAPCRCVIDSDTGITDAD